MFGQVKEAKSNNEWIYIAGYLVLIVFIVATGYLAILATYNSAFPEPDNLPLKIEKNVDSVVATKNIPVFEKSQQGGSSTFSKANASGSLETIDAEDFFSVYKSFKGNIQEDLMKHALLYSYENFRLIGTGTIETVPMNNFSDVVRNSKTHFVGIKSFGFLFECFMEDEIIVTQFEGGQTIFYEGTIRPSRLRYIGSLFKDSEFTLNKCNIYVLESADKSK